MDTGGGGRESNIHLIPYIIHTVLYVLNTSVPQTLRDTPGAPSAVGREDSPGWVGPRRIGTLPFSLCCPLAGGGCFGIAASCPNPWGLLLNRQAWRIRGLVKGGGIPCQACEKRRAGVGRPPVEPLGQTEEDPERPWTPVLGCSLVGPLARRDHGPPALQGQAERRP